MNLRLVNGTDNPGAGLALAADFALVQQDVLAGGAGDYASVPGDSSMQLQVTSPLSATPIYEDSALNIPAGSVYSIFVLGNAAAPTTILRKDR